MRNLAMIDSGFRAVTLRGAPVAAMLAALLAGGAAPALAQSSYEGLWRAAPDNDCTRVGEDGGALRIAEGVFQGVESRCEMTQPVNVRDMDATLFDMECSGEGLEWQDRAMFMRAADGGLIMVWNGYAFKYEACPLDPEPQPEPAAGTVTTADQLGVPAEEE